MRRRENTTASSFFTAGFGSEDDQESPPRERPENRAPQAAPSQEGSPDKRPAQFYGASGPQSSRGRKQGPEGTEDDPPGEGEVSRLPRQEEALRLPLAAPRSSHPPVPPRVQRASQLHSHRGIIGGERPQPDPNLRPQHPSGSPPTPAQSGLDDTPSVGRASGTIGPHRAPEDAS